MVLVSVGDEKGLHFGTVIFQISVVGNNVIHARERGFGKAHPRIDEDDGSIGFEAVGVLAYFAQASKGIDFHWGVT